MSTIVGSQSLDPQMAEGSKNSEAEVSTADLSCPSHPEKNKHELGANPIATQNDECQEKPQQRKKPYRRDR